MIQRVFILQRNLCLNFTEKNWLTLQNLRFPRSILMSFKCFTCVRHCSVDTELIDRNYDAKNCFNCWVICSEVYRQFSMSLTFENTPGQWSRCTESRMSAFCEFQQHFVRDMIPSSLWAILCRVPLLFRTWSNKWPLSNTNFSRKYFDDSGICQTFFFVAFSVTGDVIEHWHE